MFTEKITFSDGIIVNKQLFTEAVLEEEVFNHTLRASSLPGIDSSRLDDQAYFAAALLAVRLKISGLFEARLAHDAPFKEMVEEFAEATGRPLKQITAAQIHPVSAEMVEELSRVDGRLLLMTTSTLSQRRAEFRNAALAAADGSDLPVENGVPGSGDPAEEPGGNPGDLQSV